MEVIFEWSAAFFRGLFGANWLGAHFGIVKTLHVYNVMLWTSSAIGGFYYLVVAARERHSNKGDEELRRRYEWALWHFNKVVILEHIALIIILPTGLMLATTLGWNQKIGWLAQKVAIVSFVFIPMEIMDIALAHWIVPRAMLARIIREARRENVKSAEDPRTSDRRPAQTYYQYVEQAEGRRPWRFGALGVRSRALTNNAG